MKASVKPERALCAFIAAHRGEILQTHAELTSASHAAPWKLAATVDEVVKRPAAPVVLRLPGCLDRVWVADLGREIPFYLWQSGDSFDPEHIAFARTMERKIDKARSDKGLGFDFREACATPVWQELRQAVLAQPLVLPTRILEDVYPLGFIGK